ncbi:MAG: hypothetical protein ACI8RA_001365 [Chlamydiales bacterium]|jgi:hypothetical protein
MNQNTEDKTNEYKQPFPSTAGLSDEEAFIESHSVVMDGAVYGCEYDYTFHESNLDFSKYSSIQLNVSMGDLDPYCLQREPKRGLSIQKDFLEQDFFDELVPNEADTPELLVVEHDDFYEEEAKKKRGKAVSLDCTFYPISTLSRSLLYKVDVKVEIWPDIPLVAERRATGHVVVNFLQKYFVVDREGMFFKQQAKKALKQCFQCIPGAFTSTRDNKVYVVKDRDRMVPNKNKKAEEYKSPPYRK